MPMMEYGGGGNSMIENWPHCWKYTSAYYKGCDIFNKVSQKLKEMGDYTDFPHIDIMISHIRSYSRTCNKEILNLLIIFKNTMYEYRKLWDEDQKYRDQYWEFRKKGYLEEDIEGMLPQWEEIHQQMNKCEDIMIQQLEKAYPMFLERKDQGYWSAELGSLRSFIKMCSVLGFNTRAAREKARKKIGKRRLEKMIDKLVEEKLSKLEKKIDKLLSKEELNNGR